MAQPKLAETEGRGLITRLGIRGLSLRTSEAVTGTTATANFPRFR